MRRRVFTSAVDSRLAKAVAYARVSSKEQEREGYSIQAQQALVRDYAAGRGMAIAKEFVDVETAKQAGRAPVQFDDQLYQVAQRCAQHPRRKN